MTAEEKWGRYSGLFIPVTTPFDAVTGEIAPVHFRNNLRKWVDEPIDGYVLFGSTGEGVLVEDDEKVRLLEYAREVIPPGRPIVAGITADSTRAIIKKAKRFADAGAEAFLIAPPPYFGAYLSPAAMIDHYRAIADESPAGIIVYHIPKFTKVVLEAGLIADLVRHPNVIGLKDSSGDVKKLADFTDACGRDCALFVGNGALLYTALELGASGGIVGIGEIAPREVAALIQAFCEGRSQKAGELQDRLAPVHKEIVAAYGAVGVKTALDLIGYYGGAPRRPLIALGAKEKARVAQVMQEAAIL